MSMGYTSSSRHAAGPRGRFASGGLPVTSLAGPLAGQIMQPSHVAASGAAGRSRGTAPSLAARLEALELAMATLSDRVADAGSSPEGSEQAHDNIQDRLYELEDTCKDMCNKFTSQAVAEMQSDVIAYRNSTGDCDVDIKAGAPGEVCIKTGTQLRLMYPQYTAVHAATANESVFMHGTQIDPDTMQVTNVWVPIYDKARSLHLVVNFRV